MFTILFSDEVLPKETSENGVPEELVREAKTEDDAKAETTNDAYDSDVQVFQNDFSKLQKG